MNNSTDSNNVVSNVVSSKQAVREQVRALGENFGEFKAYDSQLPLADIEGTRIIKCLYQVNTKTGKKKQENSYTRIMTSHLTDETVKARIDELAPFVVGWLESLEDKIVKAEHEKGALSFFTDKLGIDFLLSYLEENAESGRLTKEAIAKWFVNNLEVSLLEVVADKLNISLQDDISEADEIKIQRVVDAYKTKFESLASPKVVIKESDCLSMINVIKSYDANETSLGLRFITKLEGMNKKVEETLLEL